MKIPAQNKNMKNKHFQALVMLIAKSFLDVLYFVWDSARIKPANFSSFRKMKIIKTLILFLTFAPALAQAEHNLPGNLGVVSLPEGYVYVPKQGIDSVGGLLTNEEGASVSFDFGPMAGIYVDSELDRSKTDEATSIVRHVTTKIDGLPVKILIFVFGDQKWAIVSYPENRGNFFCKYRNEAELADFLIISLSYRPLPTPEKQDATNQPDPALRSQPEGQ